MKSLQLEIQEITGQTKPNITNQELVFSSNMVTLHI